MVSEKIEHKFPVTLQTFLCYTNVWINPTQRIELFRRIQDFHIPEDEIPYKKKKKEPYTKQINAPIGRIFGLSCGDESWGVVKTKKTQHSNSSYNEDKMLQTMLTGESDVKDTFKNTLCIYMSMPENNVHIMRFSDIMKVAGCKNVNDCILAITLLWKHIEPHTDCYEIMHTVGENPLLIKHAFDSSMINLNFSAHYLIDREKFLCILKEKYSDQIEDARWQETQNNILVRFKQSYQEDIRHKTIFFQRGSISKLCIAEISQTELHEIKQLIFAFNRKAAPKHDKTIKPIRIKVNRTSTVMATGKYLNKIEETCNFVMQILKENEDQVKEILRENSDIDDDFGFVKFYYLRYRRNSYNKLSY